MTARAGFWRLIGLGALWVMLLAPAPARADQYALVIGINDCPAYRLDKNRQTLPLSGAEFDARSFAQLLTGKFGFPRANVELLQGASADYKHIRAGLQRLTRTRPGDVVVIYYSGHGTQLPDRKPWDEDDGLDEALCPYDCDADGHNLLVDDELGLLLEDIPAGRVEVILDCCHSGTATKEPDANVVPKFLPMKTAAQRQPAQAPWRELRDTAKSLAGHQVALFACQPSQQAYERHVPKLANPPRVGQFTHYLLAGLADPVADADHNGRLTNGELLNYIKQQLDDGFNRDRTAADRQEPMLEGGNDEPALFITSSEKD